ncbi:MAG: potassium channel family protein, partial [Bacteroidales bacterium]
LAIVVSWLSYNSISSLFVTYLTILLSTVYFSSLLFYSVEQNLNPLVTQYSDSLWWAFMDVTTVGSNIYAVTSFGKILSVVLAAMGMMMFPIFTVYITDRVTAENKKKREAFEQLYRSGRIPAGASQQEISDIAASEPTTDDAKDKKQEDKG